MNIPPGAAFPSLLKADNMVSLDELDEARAEDLVNYEGLEDSAEAASEIAKHADAGRLAVCDTLDQVKEFLGEDPVVSKLELEIKTKAGGTKRTLILDTKGLARSTTR